MKKVFGAAKLILVILVFVLVGALFVEYYDFIFSRVVTGPIVSVERVEMPMIFSNVNNQAPPSQVYSFAVGIKDEKTGEIIVASTEDRQWAAVIQGNCATARFYPYPPWKLDKAGTYHNARLLHLYTNCAEKRD